MSFARFERCKGVGRLRVELLRTEKQFGLSGRTETIACCLLAKASLCLSGHQALDRRDGCVGQLGRAPLERRLWAQLLRGLECARRELEAARGGLDRLRITARWQGAAHRPAGSQIEEHCRTLSDHVMVAHRISLVGRRLPASTEGEGHRALFTHLGAEHILEALKHGRVQHEAFLDGRSFSLIRHLFADCSITSAPEGDDVRREGRRGK
mmetsp:Transcript_14173/g.36731  ORF Transcript_14173/g.36731 Transcript_14173/m.36731 type:complete len:210 (-) Transcript_14173:102-731(-)